MKEPWCALVENDERKLGFRGQYQSRDFAQHNIRLMFTFLLSLGFDARKIGTVTMQNSDWRGERLETFSENQFRCYT